MLEHKKYKQVVLVVLDGFGVASYSRGNAVGLAQTPNFNFLVSAYPALTLQASGPLVGLPWGEMGNSEVGHLNMGAGRIAGQDLPRINASIQNGEFFINPIFLEAVEHVKKNGSALHLMGMVSNGNVHSSDEHLYALMSLAKDQGIEKLFIHMFTDGRDTAEKYALESLTKLNDKITAIGLGKVATITGRFYALDRGGHWQQTEAAYNAMVYGKGEYASDTESAILKSYENLVYDEMIKPTVITESDGNGGQKPIGSIKENDSVIFFNFRPDRAVQLTRAFVDTETVGFTHGQHRLPNLYFVCMTEHVASVAAHVAFPTASLTGCLPEVISKAGLKQFHTAESEKYAHVTSFFNCGVHEPFPGEEREIVKSPDDNKNYELHPEMSAEEITNEIIEKLNSGQFNFILANFANGDMVGHTGNLDAAVKAVTFLDICIGKIVQAVLSKDAALIITADHGNCERMIDPRSGEIDKDHTINPVPCLIVANEFKLKSVHEANLLSLSAHVPDGVISDIAATVLSLFGIEKPKEMTAVNLFKFL
ncbi:MAG TPA: 2,3-bisphosphoglycerate-independent phosphoglycerate mutase [Patescibacteria group bacterium]|nr:2,3-bisphosphoglycerate-independent phosphoglycerate mutase [Patescibacteria group bacterium]